MEPSIERARRKVQRGEDCARITEGYAASVIRAV
jgi:hypothetical protein